MILIDIIGNIIVINISVAILINMLLNFNNYYVLYNSIYFLYIKLYINNTYIIYDI